MNRYSLLTLLALVIGINLLAGYYAAYRTLRINTMQGFHSATTHLYRTSFEVAIFTPAAKLESYWNRWPVVTDLYDPEFHAPYDEAVEAP